VGEFVIAMNERLASMCFATCLVVDPESKSL
jgi:hypothetical protein